jgi:hypothetical protein
MLSSEISFMCTVFVFVVVEYANTVKYIKKCSLKPMSQIEAF